MQEETISDACLGLATALARLLVAVQLAQGGGFSPTADGPVEEFGADNEFAPPTEWHIKAESGKQRIFIYMAGARGLAVLARTHGLSIMKTLGLSGEPYIVKCGTSTIPLETRLQQIGRDRYGASVRQGKEIIVEPGFERWISHMVTTSRPSTDPTITLTPRAIVVDLPPTMSRRHFDKALQDGLRERALAGLSTTVMPKRYSSYDLGTVRLSAARELYALSPLRHADGDFLLAVVENIIRRHRDQPVRSASICAPEMTAQARLPKAPAPNKISRKPLASVLKRRKPRQA